MSFECEICSDTEFILVPDENGNEVARPCECRTKKLAKRQFRLSGISDEYQKKGFKDFEDRGLPQLVAAKANALKYYQDFLQIEGDRQNSIILCGQVGCGKTHLGMAICNNLLAQNNVGVVYMAYRNVVTKIKQYMTDELNYSREIGKYMNARLLYIDDMLKGKVTESDVNIMYEIINYRYMNNLPIVISTEKTPDEIIEFDEATGSRILEMCKKNMVYLTGKELNYRLYNKNK
jgi:DNA replication protein DnaC